MRFALSCTVTAASPNPPIESAAWASPIRRSSFPALSICHRR